MTDKFKGLHILFGIILSVLGFLALYSIKISHIVGSQFSFFSGIDAITPMSGSLGMFGGSFIFLLRVVWRILFLQASPMIALYHIPGLCASYYWASKSKWISIGIPFLSMFLFCMHPQGLLAVPYVLYWFIPIILSLRNRSSMYEQALISTFIAHAVGSVIWLYVYALPAGVWLSLIPIVALERFSFAGLMVVVYYAGSWITEKMKKLVDLKALKRCLG